MNTAQEALDRFDSDKAWKPYVPEPSNPWDEVRVAHLYRRAGFGTGWRELRERVKSSPGELVGRLMAGPSPEEEREFEGEVARLRDGTVKGNGPLEAKALWIYRMLHSPHPLRERMTLFWHNHFATSNSKVRSVALMQQQNETLRRHALGRFDALLAEIAIDPAMLLWLDSDTNRKNAPNENFAREVMELFSLGVGNYTEKDIQEAARAFTGWKMASGRAAFDATQFDDSKKSVFGQTGRWTSGDVVRLCLSQAACSRHIVRKLFRQLVSETAVPSDALLAPLTEGFRDRNYDIAWLVETMLQSSVFFSAAAIRQKVKGPCDFLLGTVLALGGRFSLTQLALNCDQLGQSLFHPPSVKGWDGGPAWLNSSTFLKRQNFAFEMTRGAGALMRLDPARFLNEKQLELIHAGKDQADRTDPARLLDEHGVSGSQGIAEFFLRLFHQQVDPQALASIVRELEDERAAGSAAPRGESQGEAALARSAAHLAMTLPEYQLG